MKETKSTISFNVVGEICDDGYKINYNEINTTITISANSKFKHMTNIKECIEYAIEYCSETKRERFLFVFWKREVRETKVRCINNFANVDLLEIGENKYVTKMYS